MVCRKVLCELYVHMSAKTGNITEKKKNMTIISYIHIIPKFSILELALIKCHSYHNQPKLSLIITSTRWNRLTGQTIPFILVDRRVRVPLPAKVFYSFRAFYKV